MRFCISLFCRLAIPLNRFHFVFFNTPSAVVINIANSLSDMALITEGAGNDCYGLNLMLTVLTNLSFTFIIYFFKFY